MPYKKPTLTELRARIRSDIYTGLGLVDQFLRKGFIPILSDVLAGVFNGLFGNLAFNLLQMFPDTADSEFVRRWKTIKNLVPIVAKQSSGFIDVTGVISSTVPLDAELVTLSGQVYKVTLATVLDVSPKSVPVISDAFGIDTVLQAGVTMTFVSVPAGVDSEATVDGSGITGGRNEETTEECRDRVLESFRRPPQGGSDADHDRWAREILPITRTWIRTFDAVSNPYGVLRCQVIMYFAMHDTYIDGIPQPGDVVILQDYIDARRPAGEEFVAIAPIADPVDFDITLVPNNATTKAAVDAELKDLIRRKGEEGGTLKLSDMQEAIGRAPGIDDWTLNSPTADITTALGELHTLGTTTYS